MGDKKKIICQEVLTAVKKKQGKEPNGGRALGVGGGLDGRLEKPLLSCGDIWAQICMKWWREVRWDQGQVSQTEGLAVEATCQGEAWTE